jgi:hypothetical protein
MTVVAFFLNFFKDPTLSIPQKAKGFAMSHTGCDYYYIDMAGKKQSGNFIGITTLYLLSEDGTRIFLADPWIPNKFENELTGPEEGRFKAEVMAASSSTLFLFANNQMYTRCADFDTIGSNPCLPATYDAKNCIPLFRYLPAEDWIKQPSIPLKGEAFLTKNIAVVKTGRGQEHRELRKEN